MHVPDCVCVPLIKSVLVCTCKCAHVLCVQVMFVQVL